MVDDRYRDSRCWGVAIVRINKCQHIVSGQHFKNRLLSRFAKRMGVSTDIDRTTNPLGAAVFDDGLCDGQDVLLIE